MPIPSCRTCLGNMATAPALLEGYMTLAGIFDKTELSETERQIILMTNNRLNGCTYCMAAHTTISQMAKVPVRRHRRAARQYADRRSQARGPAHLHSDRE